MDEPRQLVKPRSLLFDEGERVMIVSNRARTKYSRRLPIFQALAMLLFSINSTLAEVSIYEPHVNRRVRAFSEAKYQNHLSNCRTQVIAQEQAARNGNEEALRGAAQAESGAERAKAGAQQASTGATQVETGRAMSVAGTLIGALPVPGATAATNLFVAGSATTVAGAAVSTVGSYNQNEGAEKSAEGEAIAQNGASVAAEGAAVASAASREYAALVDSCLRRKGYKLLP